MDAKPLRQSGFTSAVLESKAMYRYESQTAFQGTN